MTKPPRSTGPSRGGGQRPGDPPGGRNDFVFIDVAALRKGADVARVVLHALQEVREETNDFEVGYLPRKIVVFHLSGTGRYETISLRHQNVTRSRVAAALGPRILALLQHPEELSYALDNIALLEGALPAIPLLFLEFDQSSIRSHLGLGAGSNDPAETPPEVLGLADVTALRHLRQDVDLGRRKVMSGALTGEKLDDLMSSGEVALRNSRLRGQGMTVGWRSRRPPRR